LSLRSALRFVPHNFVLLFDLRYARRTLLSVALDAPLAD